MGDRRKKKKNKKERTQWIFDSPLARRSLNGMVERDTVKGSLWRPTKGQKKKKSTIQSCVMITRSSEL